MLSADFFSFLYFHFLLSTPYLYKYTPEPTNKDFLKQLAIIFKSLYNHIIRKQYSPHSRKTKRKQERAIPNLLLSRKRTQEYRIE